MAGFASAVSAGPGRRGACRRPGVPPAGLLVAVSLVWVFGFSSRLRGQVLPFSAPETRYRLSETVQVGRADSALEQALEQARAHLSARQWDEAVDVLTRLSETAGNKLVAVNPWRFIGARPYCQIQLAALPPEALAVYRRRVDPVAQGWYERGIARRDRRLLEQVVEQALASRWADKALLALGEIWLEEGHFAAARAAWERILPVPAAEDPQAPRTWPGVAQSELDLAAVRARLVLASILEGSTARARHELAQLAALHPDARGRLGGVETRYVEALGRLLEASAHWPSVPPPRDWPTLGGSQARNQVAWPASDIGGVLWRVPLPTAPGANPRIFGSQVAARRVADDPQAPLSYHPVVVGGLVFVATQTTILGFDLRTGAPAWGFGEGTIYRDAAATEPAAMAALNPPETLGAARFTLTAAGGLLLARMGSAASGQASALNRVRRPNRLVALDLSAQGRLALAPIAAEEGWTFEGTPVSDGSRLYVAMRRHEVRPQLHVAAFDAETGQRCWRQFVCAADSPASNLLLEATNNLLTLHAGVLYYNTNAGAIAALGTQDGHIRWLTRYPRATEGDLLHPPPHLDRDLVPCVYDRGRLFVAPADSPRIYCLDAFTGQMLWQTGPEVEDVVHLLGVAHDYLIAAGHRLYWIALAPPDEGKVKAVWPDGPEKLGYGRGTLAGDCVWWPTREKIYVFSQRTGRPVRQILLPPLGLRGGNLVMTPECLLVASGTTLAALGVRSDAAAAAGRLCQAVPESRPPTASVRLADGAVRAAFTEWASGRTARPSPETPSQTPATPSYP